MNIQILNFRRSRAFRKIGSNIRQTPPTDGSLSDEMKSAEAVFGHIQRISAEIRELASGTYFWARRPLLGVTLAVALVLLAGAASSVKNSAAGGSDVSDQNDLLREINAAALNTMITQKHYQLAPKDAEIEHELHELELDLRGVTDAMGEKAAFEADIADARRHFFATYPDKPGAAEARTKFSDLLWEKDLWYLRWRYLAGRETNWNALLDSMTGGEVDGGIPPPARLAFDYWVKAVHEALLNNHWESVNDLLAMQERTIKAILASES